MKASVIPLSEGFKSDNDDIRHSIIDIEGDDGTKYGKGVYLGDYHLEGLTDEEKTNAAFNRLIELRGKKIDVFNKDGTAETITIGDVSRKIPKRKKRQ